jgi:hypothetical protein
VAQPGSAPALGAGSRRFESGRPDSPKAAHRAGLRPSTLSASVTSTNACSGHGAEPPRHPPGAMSLSPSGTPDPNETPHRGHSGRVDQSRLSWVSTPRYRRCSSAKSSGGEGFESSTDGTARNGFRGRPPSSRFAGKKQLESALRAAECVAIAKRHLPGWQRLWRSACAASSTVAVYASHRSSPPAYRLSSGRLSVTLRPGRHSTRPEGQAPRSPDCWLHDLGQPVAFIHWLARVRPAVVTTEWRPR